jgi:VanZ family protein
MENSAHSRSKGWYLLLVFLWIAFIGYMSFQTNAQQTIQPWLRSNFTPEQLSNHLPDVTIHYLNGEVQAKKRPYTFVEFLFRKGAHVFVYSMLALLSYLFVGMFVKRAVWRAAGAFSMVLLVGILDEWNQSFSPFRTGVFQDVGIDLAGACFLLVVLLLVERRRI